jgi:MFS family permease
MYTWKNHWQGASMSRFFSIVLVIAFIVAVELGGVYVLDLINYEWLQAPFLILVALILIVMPFLLVRRGKITQAPIRDIPAKLMASHDELLSLGFKLIDFAVTKKFFQSSNQWFYLNETERVYAYLHEGGGVWFSSYFEKNFDVTTRFRYGDTIESKKYVAHVVKTSISQAFDYHLHHREQYGLQYGSLLLFQDFNHHLGWNSEQEVEKVYKKHMIVSVSKQLGRFGLAVAVLFILFLVFAFVLMGFLMITGSSREEALAFYMLWTIPFFGIGLLVAWAWAFWPTFFPKTVEDRKGKKNVEASKDEKQELYPF